MTETLILIVILGVLMIANQVIHWKERGDLLDRLMARDLQELVNFQIERTRAKVKEDPRRDDLVAL